MRESEDIYLQAYNIHNCICTVCVCVLECEIKQNQKKVHIHYSSMCMEECLLYLVAFGVSYRRD